MKMLLKMLLKKMLLKLLQELDELALLALSTLVWAQQALLPQYQA